MRHAAPLLAFALLFAASLLGTTPAKPAVLQLTGRADGSKPDILFLAPTLSGTPEACRKALRAAEPLGTTLPNATLTERDFRSGGPLPVLHAAGYRLIPVQGLGWVEACSKLEEMQKWRAASRDKDRIDFPPTCVLLAAEATAEELAATLPALLRTDALVILAPQGGKAPVVVCWRNIVWPAHVAPQTIRPDHWTPTLAEIVGLPPPAELDAVSILPLLTGVGYQRPLEPPSAARIPTSVATGRPYAMLSHFADLPKDCPWVPDFTDVASLKPDERLFLPHTVPLPAEAANRFGPSRREQGFYVRTTQRRLTLTFPKGVSCVIRVKGRPVFSVWKPKEPSVWRLDGPETVTVELFVVVPPRLDPAKLPIFLPPAPETDPEPED